MVATDPGTTVETVNSKVAALSHPAALVKCLMYVPATEYAVPFQ
jgi:hypothetical protein